MLAKDRAVKFFMSQVMCAGEREKRFGVSKLRMWNIAQKTYIKCTVITKIMDQSAMKYFNCKSLFYRLLLKTVYRNPMNRKWLDSMIFNTPCEFTVSFWKLKRIGEGIGHVTNKQLLRCKRMNEILRKHLMKEMMRSFYKINHLYDPEDSLTHMSQSQPNTPLLSKNVSRNVSRNKAS